MAAWLWIGLVSTIATLAVGVAIASGVLLLIHGDEATVSAWLRANPGWFWVPATTMVAAIVAMVLHLYCGWELPHG